MTNPSHRAASFFLRAAVCGAAWLWGSAGAAAATPPPEKASTTTAATFERLSTLVGHWRGRTASGRTHDVDYRLTAGGTVLVETWTLSPTRESMTLYALDGERLLATHYCPQGNQPRLKWIGSDAVLGERFEFQDGTNLRIPGHAHQQSFRLKIVDRDHFERAEHYVPDVGPDEGDSDETVVYERISSPSAAHAATASDTP